MEKLRLLPTRKTQIDAGLVGVGDIMPDSLMFHTSHADYRIWHEVEYPVQIMRAPVIEHTARNGRVRMPVIAGMSIAADKGLDIKKWTNRVALHDLLYSQVVWIPAPTLVDRQGTLPLSSKLDHLVGLGGGQAKWLLDHHMFTCAQHLQGKGGMSIGRRRDHHHINRRIFRHLGSIGTGVNAGKGLHCTPQPFLVAVAHQCIGKP